VHELQIPRKEVKNLVLLVNGMVGVAVGSSLLIGPCLAFILWHPDLNIYKPYLKLVQFLILIEMSQEISIFVAGLIGTFLVFSAWVVVVPTVTKMLEYVVSQSIWNITLRKLWLALQKKTFRLGVSAF
jgi:hypothetical protein